MPKSTDHRAMVVRLERLAYRCRTHGYDEHAAKLRALADTMNDRLPPGERVDPRADECRVPVEADTLRDFIDQVNEALREAGELIAADTP